MAKGLLAFGRWGALGWDSVCAAGGGISGDDDEGGGWAKGFDIGTAAVVARCDSGLAVGGGTAAPVGEAARSGDTLGF